MRKQGNVTPPAAKPVKAQAKPVAKPVEASPVPVSAPVTAKAEISAPAPTPVEASAPAPVEVPAETQAAPSVAPPQKGSIEMATTLFSAEKFQTMFADLNDRAKQAMEKSAKFNEELADLTKGNLEAVAESAKIAAKGAESLAQEAASYTKKNFETMSATMKRYSAVKSPVELIQLNSELAKSSFDNAVAEASKMSEVFTKLAGDVFQPLSNRYALAAEKLKASAF